MSTSGCATIAEWSWKLSGTLNRSADAAAVSGRVVQTAVSASSGSLSSAGTCARLPHP